MASRQFYQIGSGMEPGLLMYRPNLRRQHGNGLGSFFGRIFQMLVPFAKNTLLPHATNAVKNVVTDFAEGKDVKQSLKRNAIGVLKGVGSDVLNQSGSGKSRGKKRKANRKSSGQPSKRRRTVPKPKPAKKSHKRSKGKKKTLSKRDYLTLFE